MDIKEVAIGTKLELTVYDYFGKVREPVFISQLEEKLEDGSIVIAVPIHEGNLVPIAIKSEMEVFLNHSKGLFVFRGVVLGRGMRQNVHVMRVEIVSDFVKIQRREYFRFTWLMPVTFRILESETDAEKGEQSPLIRAVARDISGGGVGLITNTRQNLNDIVEVELPLESDKKLVLKAKVIRSIILDADKTKYDTGIEFIDIRPREREVIIRFIFDKQSKLIQKGMV